MNPYFAAPENYLHPLFAQKVSSQHCRALVIRVPGWETRSQSCRGEVVFLQEDIFYSWATAGVCVVLWMGAPVPRKSGKEWQEPEEISNPIALKMSFCVYTSSFVYRNAVLAIVIED